VRNTSIYPKPYRNHPFKCSAGCAVFLIYQNNQKNINTLKPLRSFEAVKMPMRTKAKESCGEQCCYQVSSVVTVDARGQTVLPKDVRERLGIAAGEKLAVIIHETTGKPCCFSMIKVNDLSMMVSGPLGKAINEKRKR
jgi:antitoxin PrlF